MNGRIFREFSPDPLAPPAAANPNDLRLARSFNHAVAQPPNDTPPVTCAVAVTSGAPPCWFVNVIAMFISYT